MLSFINTSTLEYFEFDDSADPSFYAHLTACPPKPGIDYAFNLTTFSWDYVVPVAALWAAYQLAARQALDASDLVVLRCYEDGILVPIEWRDYRNFFRPIVGAVTVGDYSIVFPTVPAYPVYTTGDPNLQNIMLIDSPT